MMRTRLFTLLPTVALACVLATSFALAQEWKSGVPFEEPAHVTPGENGGPPSDAIVLFDGKDLATHWNGAEKWKVADDCAESAGGEISTKENFGSCQLHVEFNEPTDDTGTGQGRGNSGVFFSGKYEVQVLDTFENETYFDGQCGALYKQSPPLVNACRKAGEWQAYDIIYTAPTFDDEGKVVTPAFMTVLHNGVLIQNHFQLHGGTFWHKPPAYEAHGPGPISLQFHGDKVKFRNIWIRPLEPRKVELPRE